ncbi:MAG: hypothetical protein ABR910_00565 [Acidobacteriaceae bacterium]|jgi:hypothetical protein
MRWMLLVKFPGWCSVAILSAVEVGIGIARSVWAGPFTFSDLGKWIPVLILAGAIAAAQAELQRVLDGAYFGGECDRNRSQPIPQLED